MERQLEILRLILHSPRNIGELCRETGFSSISVNGLLEALLEAELIVTVPHEDFDPGVNYYYANLGSWYGKPWNH